MVKIYEKPPELTINGMTTIPDTIDMIKDTIDDGDLRDAIDYLDQFKEYLAKRDNNILALQKTGEDILKNLELKIKQPRGC
tara:strand:- start:36 stop:278 length:243 start_codon:yes stop_codon:yes gene_type:complete